MTKAEQRLMTFGTYFKERRIKLKKTLRGFCREHSLDPGNISKLERGRVAPPQKLETLIKYGQYLALNQRELEEFQELAALENGRIPACLSDGEIAKKLPLIFSVLKGEKTEENLRQLVDIVRNAWNETPPDNEVIQEPKVIEQREIVPVCNRRR